MYHMLLRALKTMIKTMINYYFKIREFKVYKQEKLDKIKGTCSIWTN